jgi:hypothetical protein
VIIFADKICRRDLPPRRSPGSVLECGEGLRLEFGLPFFGLLLVGDRSKITTLE